jgi:GntR family transcriptional regulator, transcriptional repressor for pyruvate dehydrogenase complex
MAATSEVRPHRPVERGRVADQILEDLRDQILQGVLTHGTQLPTERELARRYGVSGGTIREAVRGLTAMGLIDVRHGSGAYVTATGDGLVAMSIASVIQLENVGALDVLGILGVLNTHAVELATTHATDEELAALYGIAERLALPAETLDEAATDLTAFLQGIATASHNPLLAAFCKVLSGLQVALALEICDGNLRLWRKVAGALAEERLRIVRAMQRRDAGKATAMLRAYHARALTLLSSVPRVKEVRLSDPRLVQTMWRRVARREA